MRSTTRGPIILCTFLDFLVLRGGVLCTVGERGLGGGGGVEWGG